MLRRTGFARKVYTPRRSPPPSRATRSAQYSVSSLAQPIPKREYIRSPKLLAAVRNLPCQVTGIVGQTEPAHSNWAVHGKGKSIKADDNRVAALCRAVHRDLDQGSRLTEAQRQLIWWSAHVSTVRQLLDRGQWPARVPVPDIDNCPFDLPETA